jgi:hypothetical protein
VAAQFHVSLCTVQRWVARAQDQRLDRVDWRDRPDVPRRTQRTSRRIEQRVLIARRWLQRGVLGECGAAAIRQQLLAEGLLPCPALRTIGRILERHGVLDGRRRVRRPPPPAGWYLPAVAERAGELDSFDTIEGLAIRGGPHLTVLTGISLHGGLAMAWPQASCNASQVVVRLMEHWRAVGLPAYAQFDNDNRFLGPKQHPDAIGRVIRCCLDLHVTPVFVPPNEMGFQASIESFNGRWQSKVWSRWTYRTLPQLQRRSQKYLAAIRSRGSTRLDAAPARMPFPGLWQLDLQRPPQGTLIFLRRTNDRGQVQLLGRSFPVDLHWPHRLVRAEADLAEGAVRFYALRRRSPEDQPLLHEVPYRLPTRSFKE